MRTSKGLQTEVVFIFSNMVRRITNVQKPDYLVAVFEGEGKGKREEEFAEYKANRSETPQELLEQIPYVRRYLEAMRIPCVSAPGYEADDVIGSLARQATEQGVDTVIVSSDKDLLQLVNDRVSMLNPMKDDLVYTPSVVQEFMGVPPQYVADLLALKGDSVDNIPGAPGIGDKGAKDLILEYGPVEQLLERAAEVKKKTYRESLLNHREQVLLSKRLATVDVHAPCELHLENFRVQGADKEALRDLFRELEFFSQLKELGPVEDAKPRHYRELQSSAEVQAYVREAGRGPLVFLLYEAGEGLLTEEVVGLSREVGEGCWFASSLLPALGEWLADAGVEKIAFDYKTLLGKLAEHGVRSPQGFVHDVLIYSFLLSPENAAPGLAELAERDLNRKLDPNGAQAADVVRELYERYRPQLEARDLLRVYREIDGPVTPVLFALERAGVRVDRKVLSGLSGSMDAELQRLASSIYGLAGKEFNINSPKQLGRVLYEDLGLPAPFRYGKGKTLSTAADILEELAEAHEIARLVLEYRQIAKLKGTYVDALPALLDRDDRVHTTFSLTTAATGRLSSSNPNLQNIPIRSELGREIRAAFVPMPGCQLIAADYSQIELRLLAHMSADPVLVDAFQQGQDIHSRTAAEVFGLKPEEVTSEHRRYAKTVNFGIIYGQTSFGLAKGLGISRTEADEFIKKYFATYKGVREFIDSTIARARETGMTQTMFGRQRPLVDIKSRNPNARGFAERVAVNAPLQGTAADLIKLSMIAIEKDLSGMQSRMVLQVHDELLFEAADSEVAQVTAIARRHMEGVAELRVPLVVEVGVGENWRDAK